MNVSYSTYKFFLKPTKVDLSEIRVSYIDILGLIIANLYQVRKKLCLQQVYKLSYISNPLIFFHWFWLISIGS